jgi:outer membrane protein insertion porin family
MKEFRVLFFLLLNFILLNAAAQPLNEAPSDSIIVSYTNPAPYIIGGISISGIQFLDPNDLIARTGLRIGDKITVPSDHLSSAIKKLWEQGLVGDITLRVLRVEGNLIYLDFNLKERPRLSKFIFRGVRKSDEDDLKGKISFAIGTVVDSSLKKNAEKKVRKFYVDQGFYNATVRMVPMKDSLLPNNIILKVLADAREKVRVNKITFEGNESVPSKKLKSKLKKTKESKWSTFFIASKIIPKELEADKAHILEYYNAQGHRDATLEEEIIPFGNDRVNIKFVINEGRKYYFRNITWTGNYIYNDKQLAKILNINKGDIYNNETMQRRLSYNPSGADISSLYLDDGYLFFSVDAVEVLVEGDSIDIEMRIHEGTQATIDKITITGNTKTHDHVILRELRTIPGQKFSRADLIRTQQALSQMGYFDPEQIGINPVPNPQTGTVDVNYSIVEKPSDQVTLSGGWGGYFGFVGTLGLVFNNFSAKNIKNFKTWSPLPAGDGQRLGINFQANGPTYQTGSFSFTEPWLGGRKPQSLSISLTHSRQAQYFTSNYKLPPAGKLSVNGITVTLGKYLRYPDYVTISHQLSYMNYNLNNYTNLGFSSFFNTGTANNFSFNNTIARDSRTPGAAGQNFIVHGSLLQLQVYLTPPYSLFTDNYKSAEAGVRYKWVEFHKWMFDSDYFSTLFKIKGNPKYPVVLRVGAHFGLIGSYKKAAGIGPFERFVLGGSGLSGFNFLLGSDIISLRSYPNNSIKPNGGGGVAYDKFLFELRCPVVATGALSLSALTFFEGGNNWGNFSDFNPFSLYRSVGVGANIFMPAFGNIGLSYGYPLDPLPGYSPAAMKHSRITFTMGQQIR